MKYLTNAKHSSFTVVIRTYPVQVQLKPSVCKLFPSLLKDFAGVFGGIKSRDLLCISSTSQKRVYVVMKVSEGKPPPIFFDDKTSDLCLN